MVKYKVIVPFVDSYQFALCAHTLDYEVKQNVMAHDNSVNNIGVARSWNEGVKAIKHLNDDFLIILSTSVRFNDGMKSFINALDPKENGLMTQEGWHCLAINRRVFEEIGDFDTNFYPAYYEDSDYIRRMELAGFHEPCGKVTFPSVSIDCQPAEVAHSIRKAGVKVNMTACLEYFLGKWGAEPRYGSQAERDMLYKYPFNDSSKPLSYYEDYSIDCLKAKYNLKQ